ncbi:MAG: phosphatase PAP2 family protein [Candidatus Coproplasma sp.]
MDLKILIWTASTFHSQVWLNYIMKYITFIGEFGAVPIACAVIMLIFKKTRKGGFSAVFALILNFLLVNVLLKSVVNRPRPWTEFAEFTAFYEQFGVRIPTDSSFPSGHTASCFCVAVACVCAFKAKGTPALAVAFLVGLSRIYLCLHYPTDVLAGALIGSACGVAGYFIAKALAKKFKWIDGGENNHNDSPPPPSNEETEGNKT